MAGNEITNEANNSEKDEQKSENAKDQKWNLETEDIESLSVDKQEPIKEKDVSKSVEGNESSNIKKCSNKNVKHTDLLIRITGFPRIRNKAEEIKLYHAFFTKEMGINAPLVEMSARIDDSVMFQLKTEEDRKTIFSKIKRNKLYAWRTYRLEMKGVPNDSFGKKDFEKLPLDKALQILYPYNDISYRKQLKEKTETSWKLVESILPRKEANIKVKPIVPMTSVEGYDYHVPLSIEEESETKSTVFGIRVITADKKKACIVPIERCPSVPHQITLVVKDFVNHMPQCGFTPFNQKTKKGNILGITLQMTRLCGFIMTIVAPTTKLERFKQITENGADGDVVIVKNFSAIDETKESIIEKADKYFKSRANHTGILSVYLSIINPRLGFSWIGDNMLPEAVHILGDSTIPNHYNGQQIQVMWTKDHLINNSIFPILNAIQERDYIHSFSSVCLVCSHKIVALYLANRVENVIMICPNKKGKFGTLNEWAKKMGLNKIEFIDLKGGSYKNIPIRSNTNTAIILHTIKKQIVDVLVTSGITYIIFVSYWTKDPPKEFTSSCKESLESVSDKLEILNIFPIDIAPYTDRFCLLIYFHVKNSLMAPKRSYDSLERFQPLIFPNEAGYSSPKRLKMTYL